MQNIFITLFWAMEIFSPRLKVVLSDKSFAQRWIFMRELQSTSWWEKKTCMNNILRIPIREEKERILYPPPALIHPSRAFFGWAKLFSAVVIMCVQRKQKNAEKRRREKELLWVEREKKRMIGERGAYSILSPSPRREIKREFRVGKVCGYFSESLSRHFPVLIIYEKWLRGFIFRVYIKTKKLKSVAERKGAQSRESTRDPPQ